MRILFAGVTGVLGRATLPHLRREDVVGLTRSEEKRGLLREFGAETVVCDVYDYDALLRIGRRLRPETVVNFVTDLAGGSLAANNRARREGGANLLKLASTVGSSRLVVESVAFALEADAADAVARLERSTRAFAGDALILRFGRLWGPGTRYETPARPPTVHVDEAGRMSARLIAQAPPSTYTITDGPEQV